MYPATTVVLSGRVCPMQPIAEINFFHKSICELKKLKWEPKAVTSLVFWKPLNHLKGNVQFYSCGKKQNKTTKPPPKIKLSPGLRLLGAVSLWIHFDFLHGFSFSPFLLFLSLCILGFSAPVFCGGRIYFRFAIVFVECSGSNYLASKNHSVGSEGIMKHSYIFSFFCPVNTVREGHRIIFCRESKPWRGWKSGCLRSSWLRLIL